MMIDPDGGLAHRRRRTGARVPDELGGVWPPADLLAAVRRDFSTRRGAAERAESPWRLRLSASASACAIQLPPPALDSEMVRRCRCRCRWPLATVTRGAICCRRSSGCRCVGRGGGHGDGLWGRLAPGMLACQ